MRGILRLIQEGFEPPTPTVKWWCSYRWATGLYNVNDLQPPNTSTLLVRYIEKYGSWYSDMQ